MSSLAPVAAVNAASSLEAGTVQSAVAIKVLARSFARDADVVSRFVADHPTTKMLALAFLILIGVSLVVESLHQHIPKGYIYFSMAFAVMVEFLNLRAKGSHPVKLTQPYSPNEPRVSVHKAK